MPIPPFQCFFVPVLQFTADGAVHATTELREKIATSLKLTPEELAQKLPSGLQTVYANRVAWSTVYLTKAGALKRIKRGGVPNHRQGERTPSGNTPMYIQAKRWEDAVMKPSP